MIFPADIKEVQEEIFIPTLNVNTNNITSCSSFSSYSSFQQKSKEVFGNLLLPKESTLKIEPVDSYDYWRDPNKWTKYSLEDVPMSDMMSLSQAASETRKIIEMDKLRTRLKEVLSKEGNGIATLLDEEDEVFSLQTIKEYLPPPSAEIGVPKERNVKSIMMKDFDCDDGSGKSNKKVKFQLNSLSTEMAKLKLDHLTDIVDDDDEDINNNFNNNNNNFNKNEEDKLNNNKNEEKNEQKFSKRQRKPKNFYNRTSTLD